MSRRGVRHLALTDLLLAPERQGTLFILQQHCPRGGYVLDQSLMPFALRIDRVLERSVQQVGVWESAVLVEPKVRRQDTGS